MKTWKQFTSEREPFVKVDESFNPVSAEITQKEYEEIEKEVNAASSDSENVKNMNESQTKLNPVTVSTPSAGSASASADEWAKIGRAALLKCQEATMNNQDQIKSIAELDGWKVNPYKSGYYPPNLHPLCNLNQEFELPRYLTSRDAIVPIIDKCSKILEKDNHMFVKLFLQHLEEIIRRDDKTSRRIQFCLLVATSDQLCEALLRSTGKWKD